MQYEAFREWLQSRGITDKAVNTRSQAVRRMERAMAALGSSHNDLDAAFREDEFQGLRVALKMMQSDSAEGGKQYLTLLPQSQKPINRLQNYRSWLGQYGQFLSQQLRPGSGWAELELMHDEFLERVPDFESFAQTDGFYYETERSYKDELVTSVAGVVSASGSDAEIGHAIYEALLPPSGPPLRWQTSQSIHKNQPSLAGDFYSAIGRLARSGAPTDDEIVACALALRNLRERGAASLTNGEVLAISFSVAGFVDPNRSTPFKVSIAQSLAKRLVGTPIFTSVFDPTQIEQWLGLLRRILVVMRDHWGWRPRELFDVQGFAWIVLNSEFKPVVDIEEEDELAADVKTERHRPTNVILHGPPGTGKTFETVAEAVRLCTSADQSLRAREEIRRDYDRLVRENRIRFITFHQSYAYEDFVEGLRPYNDVDEEATSEALPSRTGFRLVPTNGAFREIVAIAQAAGTESVASTADLQGKRVYKMSLGRAGQEDHIFDAAIVGGYVSTGWGRHVDWSDARYEEFDSVAVRWNEEEPGTNSNSGNIAQVWTFRTMREGDLVVVSNGNRQFRAIGEIVGPYRFDPTGSRNGYNHWRDVRWLLVPAQPLPVDAIYGRLFSQASCYRLNDGFLNRDALARLLAGPAQPNDARDQFVLIIDEINRANISKVFGELITLIEPDKRLGMPEALTLRLPYSGDDFGVPANLHIVGTMNTADRSIALLDTALRRRFEFREIMPKPELLDPIGRECGVDLAAFLSTINRRIEYLFDREHQIGHAFFMQCRTRADVDAVMRRKVLPLLAEYFYEDLSRVAQVLGDDGDAGRFLRRTRLSPPPGATEGVEERYRWHICDPFSPDCYDAFTNAASDG